MDDTNVIGAGGLHDEVLSAPVAMEYSPTWLYSVVDVSRVSTVAIAMALIVYGSFRSTGVDTQVEDVKETQDGFGVHTLNLSHALLLPLGASLSLLIMFLFFDHLQMIFAIIIAGLATLAFAFLLLPLCQRIVTMVTSNQQKVSLGYLGRHTPAEMLSFLMSSGIVLVWVLTGHWLLMDALATGLCVTMIAYVRLPSLKVSTLLLFGLLIYDIFWVFFSSYVFKTNVMVRVATRQAANPLGFLAQKLNLRGVMRDSPKLSLPAKLVFPSFNNAGHYNMLGLGDIVMPGLLLCFLFRYDRQKRETSLDNSTLATDQSTVVPPTSAISRIRYFHCSLIGYCLGLITATVCSELSKSAQPALLYLVPFTLLPLIIMAYAKGDLRRMWTEPFSVPTVHSDPKPGAYAI